MDHRLLCLTERRNKRPCGARTQTSRMEESTRSHRWVGSVERSRSAGRAISKNSGNIDHVAIESPVTSKISLRVIADANAQVYFYSLRMNTFDAMFASMTCTALSPVTSPSFFCLPLSRIVVSETDVMKSVRSAPLIITRGLLPKRLP